MMRAAISLAVVAMLSCSVVGQESNAPVLLPESAWDRPLDIRLLDIRLLDLPSLAVVDLSAETLTIPELGVTALIVTRLDTVTLDLAGLRMAGLDLMALQAAGMNPGKLKLTDLAAVKLNLLQLDIDGMKAAGLDVAKLPTATAWLIMANAEYCRLATLWETRWKRMLDVVTPEQYRFVPHPLSALGEQRRHMLKLVAAETSADWSPPTEQAWEQYHEALARALARRSKLKSPSDRPPFPRPSP